MQLAESELAPESILPVQVCDRPFGGALSRWVSDCEPLSTRTEQLAARYGRVDGSSERGLWDLARCGAEIRSSGEIDALYRAGRVRRRTALAGPPQDRVRQTVDAASAALDCRRSRRACAPIPSVPPAAAERHGRDTLGEIDPGARRGRHAQARRPTWPAMAWMLTETSRKRSRARRSNRT